ncbi:MerR family transcriptional regulator [Carnobacterium gallinarum]|uniref:MerR family transcriptional regulator n=1 Tax=Carnobacterium gallinarum TaxID=2749 RepID=UPI000553456F|nr:MerR family transcriptional regulator [Carnobacterium gallinarum]
MRINEVSQQCGISIPTLRYYEKIGLIDEVQRENGIRNYQAADLERIEFILCMKASGMSLEDLCVYFDLYRQGDDTLEEREHLLSQHKQHTFEKLQKIQQSLDYIEFKIDFTREKIQQRDAEKIL